MTDFLNNEFSLLMIGHVEPANRKVPPRTPEDRLNTLNRFLREWADSNIGDVRPNRALGLMESNFFGRGVQDSKTNTTVINWESSLFINRFRRIHPESSMPSCAYFNTENHPSGGPRMAHEPRHNERQKMTQMRRRRRDIDTRRSTMAKIDLEYDQINKLVHQLPNADGSGGLTSRRHNQTQLEEMVRNSQNFFDLYEMALVEKKSTDCTVDDNVCI